MNKKIRFTLVLCLVACMALSIGLLAACQNDEEEATRLSDDFTVTIKLSDGAAVPTTLKVNFYDASDVEDGAVLGGFRVNGEGSVTESIVELKGNKVMIVLKTRPAGYEYLDENGEPYAKEEGVVFDLTKTSSGTITLTKIA